MLTGRSNLIYCAPTSGGKTPVTEILMIRRLTSPRNRGKQAFFIVPFITIVDEKVEQLRRQFRSLGIKVGAYYSNTGGSIRTRDFADTHIIVCTIERGNSMIHQLIAAERGDEITMIIIDETGHCHTNQIPVHLLNDCNLSTDILQSFTYKLCHMLRQSGLSEHEHRIASRRCRIKVYEATGDCLLFLFQRLRQRDRGEVKRCQPVIGPFDHREFHHIASIELICMSCDKQNRPDDAYVSAKINAVLTSNNG